MGAEQGSANGDGVAPATRIDPQGTAPSRGWSGRGLRGAGAACAERVRRPPPPGRVRVRRPPPPGTGAGAAPTAAGAGAAPSPGGGVKVSSRAMAASAMHATTSPCAALTA
ncbi:MAG TPA: hypothetical protein VFC19_22605 [Candidatus Limnocylindrales bacterium]|nr:hypothetical protein [Candidatus Limnocylindrales bacterium]